MRVLFDGHQIGRGQTGNETYARETVRALVERGRTDVVLAVERNAEPPVAPRAVTIRRVPRSGLLRLAAFGQIARDTRSDVVHAIYFLPPFLGRPSVVAVHDISYELHPEFFRRSEVMRNRVLVRAAIRRATFVVTVSETSRLDILEFYGADPARVVAIPAGVSQAFHPADLARADEHAPRRLRVLGVGTLQPRKNLINLAAAIQRVSARHPVTLRLVGPDGYQANAIRNKVGLGPDVTFLGYVSEQELVKEYQAADVFVYPSLYEGFGLPVVEAMASGVPVVTSDRGALPEVAGDAALIVDPCDATAIADAILRIAEDRDLRQTLRTRGLARAHQYSWLAAAMSLEGVYEAASGR
jgi:glycosyltransferase involved in cell wall biosynthesis